MKGRSSGDGHPRPLRERVKQVTREAILQAGEAVFAERGFGGARMEDIAERAGVAVGTLYNYFDDRRAILDAVLEASAKDLAARLSAELLPTSAPFREQLERLLTIVTEQVDAHFRIHALLFEEEIESGRGGVGKKKRLMLSAFYNAASALLARAVESGALRAEDQDVYPSLLSGMVRGVFMRKLLRDDGRSLSFHVPAMARFFTEGAGRRED